MSTRPQVYFLGGKAAVEMITEWTVSGGDTITLQNQTYGPANDYDVDWGDGSVESGVTVDHKTHTYATTGAFRVKIKGDFRGFRMGASNSINRSYLTNFIQWGRIAPTAVEQMFRYCSNMGYTATDSPDLSRVGYSVGSYMFQGCSSISHLDLTGWDFTGSTGGMTVTTLTSAFNGLQACESLDMTGVDLSNVTNTASLFQNLGNNTINGCVLKGQNLDFSVSTAMSSILNNAHLGLGTDIRNWTLKASGTISLLSGMRNLKMKGGTWQLDLSGWSNTQAISSLSEFLRYSTFTSLNLTGWDLSGVGSFSRCFDSMSQLTEIVGLSSITLSSATTLSYAFNNCSRLVFDNHNFGANWGPGLSNCTQMNNMFYNAGSNTSSVAPDVSNWDVSSVTNMAAMFYNMSATTLPDTSSWTPTSLQDCSLMFQLSNLPGTIDMTSWSTPALTNMRAMFRDAKATTAFTGTMDFSSVTNMSTFMYNSSNQEFIIDLFADFSSITSLSNFLRFGAIPQGHYEIFLTRLNATATVTGVNMNMGSSVYAAGSPSETAKNNLISSLGWVITDGGAV